MTGPALLSAADLWALFGHFLVLSLLSVGGAIAAASDPTQRLGALALIAVSVAAMLRTRIGPMWLIGLGALVGALGGI